MVTTRTEGLLETASLLHLRRDQTRYLEEISTTMCSYEDLPNQELDNLKQDRQVVVVMVPFPGQGHLNQLVRLACLISSSYDDLPVYYVIAKLWFDPMP
ncbi:hypothetical protein FXO38_18756 [Capsicum annuum]|nr:hypothetical protein FXO38_18756 [Capsicum annuum]